MNQTQTRSLRKKVLSLILAVVMVVSLLPISAFASGDSKASTAASTDEFVRIFHLDCGRKYFSVDQIKDLIDAASASNYTHVELAIGNDGLRFLLDDMSVTANGTTYSSEKVKTGIQTGNKAYYNAGSVNELTQSEMDTIISYAKGKNISIIPLLNSPGHMDAIIDCMETLGMKNVAYNNSKRTISLTNTDAAAFTKALIEKYVKYFAGKGCKYFNMGADEYANDVSNGFAELINNNTYGNFVTYVNEVAGIIETAGMTPIAFNDGIYYNYNEKFGTFDGNIVISYWTPGWDGYSPASASFLANKGHKIINTNDKWYYVLGRAAGNSSGYTIATAQSGVKSVDVTTVPGGTISNPSGCMLAFWCDSPSAQYNDTEAKNVKGLISTLAANNKSYFTTVSPAEPEILTSTGSTTLDVNGGSTTLSVSNGAEATWTVDPSDGSVIKLISASNADGDSITGSRVEAVATGKGMATITATVGTKAYTMKLTVADPNEVPVEVPAGSDWTTTVKDVDLRNQVGDYDESVAKVKVSYDKKDGGITFTPVTSVSYGTAYYIQNSNGEYLDKDANWVADSTSAAEWTWDNYYLSCDGSYLRYSSGKWTTSTSRATRLYFNNGMFYGSRSLDWNGYTYSNLLGQPGSGTKADPVNASTITITGVTAGQETTVKIGDVTYRIKVTDKAPSNAMTDTSITLEYWITNYPVYPSYSGDNPSGNAYREVSSTEASSDDGIAIATETIAPDHAYSFFDGRKDVYYWQAMRLDKDNQQTSVSGDDETANGTTLTHIRYHSGAWQYKTTDGVWHYFVSTDQLVAYYLQKTEVTKEVDTYAKDWGYGTGSETPDTSSEKGQVALTFAVVYPDGTVSPTEGSMYASSTTIFNYWNGRDIGIVAPKNNSDYNIAKITVTDGKRKSNTSENVWYTYDSITWNKKTNVAGEEWYDETEVWNKSSGTTPMVNGKTSNITWSAKNTAKLVLIYLEPVEKETNLNVQYIDLNANNHVFHSYQVAMKYNQSDDVPTFTKALMLGNTVIGDKGPWNSNVNGDANYLPDEAYVTNSSNTKQTFRKDITTIPEINGIYASGLYKYMKADISEDGKTLCLYYDLNATGGKTFVVDFGLPVEIPFDDFGIANASSNVTVSFDAKDTKKTERPGNYGVGKIDMTAQTVTYTLYKTLDAKAPIPVYVSDGKNTLMRSVNIIPASTIYYEDNFVEFSAGSAGWMRAGTTETNAVQQLDELGKTGANNYGYDGQYNSSSNFSLGSAMKTRVSSATNSNPPTATFTFNGTGFDLVSMTSKDTGTILVNVVGKDGAGNDVKENWIVDTFYGYTRTLDGYIQYTWTKGEDGKWHNKAEKISALPAGATTGGTPVNSGDVTYELNYIWTPVTDQSNALYQIPVIHYTDLPYGTYTVTITPKYSSARDPYYTADGDNSYDFYLDGVRIYNPAGDTLNDQYVKDHEGYAQFTEIRDMLLSASSLKAAIEPTTKGMVFVDGVGDKGTLTAYTNYGPNNEVYLSREQAIAFKISDRSNVDTIQIGAKAPSGNTTMQIKVDGNDVQTQKLTTASDMYYKLDSVTANKTVVITNTGDNLLSLTTLKVTYKTAPTAMNSAEAIVDSDVLAQAPVMLTSMLYGEPQTFEPSRFEASWGRSVRAGQKATLTVKASDDVGAIEVNGVTIDTYRTRTERTGWGWWAKRVTYREFTYTMTAEATADYAVYALNSDGIKSEPTTATLTVKPAINWWHKWF